MDIKQNDLYFWANAFQTDVFFWLNLWKPINRDMNIKCSTQPYTTRIFPLPLSSSLSPSLSLPPSPPSLSLFRSSTMRGRYTVQTDFQNENVKKNMRMEKVRLKQLNVNKIFKSLNGLYLLLCKPVTFIIWTGDSIETVLLLKKKKRMLRSFISLLMKGKTFFFAQTERC